MERNFGDNIVSKEQIITLCSKALKYYDKRLVDHGERVAYIALNILKNYDNKDIDLKILIQLCVFHDVGAYKTEEIDRMVEFESTNVLEHSVYGYLFLKYFTPLSPYSEIILYHHTSNEKYNDFDFKYKDYANLIHLADRIDIAIANGIEKDKLLSNLSTKVFDKIQIDAFEKALMATDIYEKVANNETSEAVFNEISQIQLTTTETIAFLKMLVYTIDFKSEYTVLHSINTTQVSIYLAYTLKLDKETIEKIYFAALIHDIGKLAIDENILEFPGKLSFEQMEIMKKHVSFTEEIITDILPKDIVTIAIRHHEKLDGSGYPHNILGEQLSVSDRIVAIADIFSALVSRRSYKGSYDKTKTLAIFNDMAEKNLIDKDIVKIVNSDFDEIINLIEEKTKPIIKIYQDLQNEYLELIDVK